MSPESIQITKTDDDGFPLEGRAKSMGEMCIHPDVPMVRVPLNSHPLKRDSILVTERHPLTLGKFRKRLIAR